jgi:protein-S-isoprenylcysteine O-methyltransferase Ste14
VFLLLQLTLAGWVALELTLLVRDRVRRRGSRERDRATRILITLTIDGAVALAFVATSEASSPAIPGPHRAIGVVVIWLGLTVRIWAVATLGSAFRTTVEVDPGQVVVSAGPYARVRHPSYTGLVLIVTGLGVALGNWLALAACIALPLPALLWRIHVEEAELSRVLGAPYRSYRAQTWRLIPGVW